MQVSRLAAYLFGAAVCGAWLASAAGVARPSRMPPPAAVAPEDIRLDALAADVQSQAVRLRQRLASAPAPEGTDRNPFTFRAQRQPVAPAAASRPAPLLPPVPVPDLGEPALELIGIAETRTPAGPVRTAMITGGRDELIMVTAGQRILSRYDVVAVSVDAVELRDVETGAIRRLALR